jgi:alanyl-tRNA synthetase
MDRKSPFLHECLENLKELIEKDFKEEFKDFSRCKSALEQEEKLFFKTLSSGMKILEQELSKDLKLVSGEVAFKLHDTYGFPVDLTRTISQEKNLNIDETAFEKLMNIQKQGSKQSSMFNVKDIVVDPNLSSVFLGHEKSSCEANCIALFDDEGTAVDKITNKGFAIFSETPFYAEMGGQVGDIGSVVKKDSEIKVIDCRKVGNFHLHEVEINSGELAKDDNAKLLIDLARREKIECNHSATHLLHSALRETLGETVQQKGSLVNDEKLRFDFSHGNKLTQPEIASIESIVNSEIEKSSVTETKTMTFQAALDSGALAFFGDKYGDEVRVVRLGGEFSVELCGGTHVKNTSEIEGFIISNETSVSSGVRRIEAMTGSNLVKKSKEALTTIKELSEIMNVPQEELVGRISDVLKENKNLKSGKKAEKSLNAEELRSSNLQISGNKGELKLYKNASVEMLRRFSDKSLKDVEFYFSVFISMDEDRLSYIVTAKKENNLSAKKIIACVNECFSGSGGGRDDFAQGGSQDLADIEAKFEKLEESLKIFD